jgi:positive regulator of sigma E activity
MSIHAPQDSGVVTAINGNRITVEIVKGGGCKSCGMKGICGDNNRPIVLQFDTDGQYKIGDKVSVSVTSGMRVLSSVIVFVFPLLALIGFYAIGTIFTNEPVSVVIGFAGMVLAFLIVRILDKQIGKKVNFQLVGKREDLP